MLHRYDGIAVVHQAAHQFEKAGMVARVQAGAGLVQNVQHVPQAGSGLIGQPYALRFAAGERGGFPVEGEIAEPEPAQHAGAFQNKSPDRFDYGRFGFARREFVEKMLHLFEAHARKVSETEAPQVIGKRCRVEPFSMAMRAGERADEAEDVRVAVPFQDLLHYGDDSPVISFLPGARRKAGPAHA